MPRKYESTLTPEQRRMAAQVAIYARWSRCEDRQAATAAATHASQVARFEREVDPDGILEPAERARRVEMARKAYMTRLSMASSRARAQQRQREAILDLLRVNGSIWEAPLVIGQELGLPEQVVAGHLRALAAAGAVERQGNRALYRLPREQRKEPHHG